MPAFLLFRSSMEEDLDNESQDNALSERPFQGL